MHFLDLQIYELKPGDWDCNIHVDKVCQQVFLKENYAKLKDTIMSIKKSCGQVCDTKTSSDFEGKYYKQIWKNIDCKDVFENPNYFRCNSFKKYFLLKKKLMISSRESEFDVLLQLMHLPLYLRDEMSHHGQADFVSSFGDNREGITI